MDSNVFLILVVIIVLTALVDKQAAIGLAWVMLVALLVIWAFKTIGRGK